MTDVFAGSDGVYYTDWQVARRLEAGRWDPCMWDTENGWELVSDSEELVWLVPVPRAELPEWAEVRPLEEAEPATEIVDHRD
jgi:hypothetical protein